MKAARESLKGDRSAFDKIGDDVKALAETKKAAIDAAMKTFKSTVETAREKLKAALGNGSN